MAKKRKPEPEIVSDIPEKPEVVETVVSNPLPKPVKTNRKKKGHNMGGKK